MKSIGNMTHVFILYTLFISITFGQKRPFPQGVNYPDCIKPNHISQDTMNNSIAVYYEKWKSNKINLNKDAVFQVPAELEQYSRKNLAKKLKDILEKI